jgi:predicted PurR-regulated permease PerM
VELKNYFAGDHVKSFFKSLPQNMKSLYTMVRVPESVKEQLDALVTDPQWIEKSGMKIISVMRSLLSSVTNRSAQFFMALSSSVFTLVLIPVIAFYILLEYDNVTESVFTVIPAKFRDDAKEIIDIFQGIFSSFFRGQLTVCAVIALLMSIGLYMTGLPYAVVIGIIAGIANIVPYLGAITGIILSLVTAFFSFNFSLFISKSIYIIIIYVLIQLMDNLVLSPRIIGDSVDLHPLVIMFVLMVGAYIADFGGLLFAVPAAAVLKALWKKYGPDLEKL